jgi:thiopeptide-type bacteriocin biosynthesis protein
MEASTEPAVIAGPESNAVVRKKALLRLLAEREAERLQLTPSDEEVAAYEDSFRRSFGLGEPGAVARWLAAAGLDAAQFRELMRAGTIIESLQSLLEPQVSSRMAPQRALWTAHGWKPSPATAGCAWCRSSEPGDRQPWLQVNLTLRDAAQAQRCVVAFATAVPRLRHELALQSWFFVRKDPGVRLRLRFASAPPLDALATRLERWRRRDRFVAWTPACYEPEERLFGGADGLEAAHAFFAADSALWAEYQRAAGRSRAPTPPAVLTTLVIGDLLDRCLDGPEEVWDAWGQIAAAHGLQPPFPSAQAPAPLPEVRGAALSVRLHYQQVSAALAQRLRRLAGAGRLTVGRRRFLTSIALFHWNRFGVDLATRQEICRRLCARTDRTRPRQRRPKQKEIRA